MDRGWSRLPSDPHSSFAPLKPVTNPSFPLLSKCILMNGFLGESQRQIPHLKTFLPVFALRGFAIHRIHPPLSVTKHERFSSAGRRREWNIKHANQSRCSQHHKEITPRAGSAHQGMERGHMVTLAAPAKGGPPENVLSTR